MNSLQQWAARWQIPAAALAELRVALAPAPPAPATPTPESKVQAEIRMEAAANGCVLWRNNVGATEDEKGNHIRFGLANDSAKMNRHIKSHDLIGIRPVLILPEHVGCTIGQFLSREVKRGGWKYTGTEREKAQEKFALLVQSYGGDATFASSVGTI